MEVIMWHSPNRKGPVAAGEHGDGVWPIIQAVHSECGWIQLRVEAEGLPELPRGLAIAVAIWDGLD